MASGANVVGEEDSVNMRGEPTGSPFFVERAEGKAAGLQIHTTPFDI